MDPKGGTVNSKNAVFSEWKGGGGGGDRHTGTGEEILFVSAAKPALVSLFPFFIPGRFSGRPALHVPEEAP